MEGPQGGPATLVDSTQHTINFHARSVRMKSVYLSPWMPEGPHTMVVTVGVLTKGLARNGYVNIDYARVQQIIIKKSTGYGGFFESLVELSGYCPPSPRSLNGAFSRLSFDFSLLERPPQSAVYRSQQIVCLVHASDHSREPARVYGRRAERLGPTLCVRWLT